ncbi:flagellar basal body-associated FliL family protein [Maricaulaceae bacterium MS644]
MAEDVDDAKEDGAETDEAGGGAKKGGMKKLILFIGLPVVILLLAGVAGGLMLMGGGGDETHTAEAGHDGEDGGHAAGGVDPGDMVAANFDSLHTWSGADGGNMKITVNIRDETGRSVYLQVEFALVYTDPRLDAVLGREIVQTHLTDTYVEFLRSLRVEDIDGTMGSFRIRAEMQRRANLVLAPLEVEDVLLPALVIN